MNETVGETDIILKRLKGDPSYSVPLKGLGPFPGVKAVKGKGIPAYELLARDKKKSDSNERRNHETTIATAGGSFWTSGY